MQMSYYEISIPVKTYKIIARCDECDEELKATGEALMSNPPQYAHTCGCPGKYHRVRGRTFPCIEYVEV